MDSGSRAPVSRPARLSFWLTDLILAVTLVSTLLGVVAALFGLDALGSGPGGLSGLPMTALVLAALAGLLIGGANVIRGRTPADHWRGLLVVAGPVLLMMAFFDGVHAMDPCATGLWDLNSTVGSVRLCESWGTIDALEVHRRFHLLLHGIPGAALALLLRRGVHATVRRS